MSDDPTDAAPARIEVVAGGAPSDAQLAAVVVALTPVAGGEGGTEAAAGAPAWARAALLEGVGYHRPTRPSDLDAVTRFG